MGAPISIKHDDFHLHARNPQRLMPQTTAVDHLPRVLRLPRRDFLSLNWAEKLPTGLGGRPYPHPPTHLWGFRADRAALAVQLLQQPVPPPQQRLVRRLLVLQRPAGGREGAARKKDRRGIDWEECRDIFSARTGEERRLLR